MRIVPRAAMPTTIIDQPRINHLKNSDKNYLKKRKKGTGYFFTNSKEF
jgi:hypothetical protein